MTFTSTVTDKVIAGDLCMVYGTYVNDTGSTGGNIDTNIDSCLFIKLQPVGASAQLLSTSVDETFPCDGKAVTVVTNADESGTWIAFGHGIGW
ncbi:MAG: hypothetical protein WC365_04290 [Candidatus Babeliales bacterium]|jgi:hypothetical protein